MMVLQQRFCSFVREAGMVSGKGPGEALEERTAATLSNLDNMCFKTH
jgi:hypothetical protein